MSKLNQHGGVLKSREMKSPYSKRNIEKHQDFMAMLEEKLKNKIRSDNRKKEQKNKENENKIKPNLSLVGTCKREVHRNWSNEQITGIIGKHYKFLSDDALNCVTSNHMPLFNLACTQTATKQLLKTWINHYKQNFKHIFRRVQH